MRLNGTHSKTIRAITTWKVIKDLQITKTSGKVIDQSPISTTSSKISRVSCHKSLMLNSQKLITTTLQIVQGNPKLFMVETTLKLLMVNNMRKNMNLEL